MHDMDRVSMQHENFENEAYEFEGAGETEANFSNSRSRRARREAGEPIGEAEALELGAELLTVSGEQELEKRERKRAGRSISMHRSRLRGFVPGAVERRSPTHAE